MSYQGTGWTDQSARGSGVCRIFAGRRLRARHAGRVTSRYGPRMRPYARAG